jgi:hypothetical protein
MTLGIGARHDISDRMGQYFARLKKTFSHQYKGGVKQDWSEQAGLIGKAYGIQGTCFTYL